MIPLVIFRKILLFFAPFVIFYLLRKIGRQKSDKKSHHASIDKSHIVEGEILEENK